MTRDDILRMAQEADGHMNSHAGGIDIEWDGLLRFAALVAAAEREKIGYEVQEFFAVARFDQRHLEHGYVRVTIADVEKLVNSIRARGSDGQR